MNKKSIIIKLGGSLLFQDGKTIDLEKVTEFCNIVKNRDFFETIIIVCGGGIMAREYINAVRSFDGNEALCDTFGIDISRINSRLIITRLGNVAFPQVPKTIEEISTAKLFNKIIVMGGLQPGQSTTSVAVEVAEYINADEIVILTDVDGIFDKDPKKYKDAKMFESLTYDELQELILKSSGDKQAAAGEYRIFDAVSLQILKRSSINVFILSGSNLEQFEKFYKGDKKIVGTRISYLV